MRPLDIVLRESNNGLYVVEQVEGREILVRTLQGGIDAERWRFKIEELRVVARKKVD